MDDHAGRKANVHCQAPLNCLRKGDQCLMYKYDPSTVLKVFLRE